MLKRKHTKLPFAYDTSSLFLPWIMMLMVFLATLSLAGALATQNMVGRWSASLAGNLTIQVMPPKNMVGSDISVRAIETTKTETEKAAEFLRGLDGVKEVQVLSLAELQKLLEPWLGEAAIDDGFPLPRLIDVTLESGREIDLENLKAELVKVAPNASVDVHRVWLANLLKLANTVKLTAFMVLILVLVTTSFTVIYATITSLEVHRPAIELLHLIGARDRYIAVLFSKRTTVFSLGGALVGALVAMPLVLVTGYLARALEVGIVADGSLTSLNWIMIAVVPFVAAAISGATACFTVAHKLKKVL